MATATKFARPYAVAAYRYAANAADAVWWQEALDALVDALANPQLAAALADPRPGEAAQRNLVEGVLNGLLEGSAAQNDAFRRFTDQLLTHGRLPALAAIAGEYAQLRCEAENVLHAEIRTSLELDQQRIDLITQKLKQRFGKKEVVTKVVTDETLIGGVMIITDDNVIDSSVSARINQLRSTLRHH